VEFPVRRESLTEPEILSQGDILSFIGRHQRENGLGLQAGEVDKHGNEVNKYQPDPHLLCVRPGGRLSLLVGLISRVM
jgi:hypothetical protein